MRPVKQSDRDRRQNDWRSFSIRMGMNVHQKEGLNVVESIIQEVTEKLSSLPFVEAVVLGGSRARGNHLPDSDIDIGIYYDPESFDLDALNPLATALDDGHRSNLVVPPGAWGEWVNGGGWLIIKGYHVDLILRDMKRVEKIMDETGQGIVTANYQTGHPHGYISAMYRGELAISQILYAKSNRFVKLKKQAEIYPDALKESMIRFFLFEAGFSLEFARANAKTGDKYYVAGQIFRAVSCLNQVLFALNRQYCINEKKAVELVETFEYKPQNYRLKVNRIFEALGTSLPKCCDKAEQLYHEVKQTAGHATEGE